MLDSRYDNEFITQKGEKSYWKSWENVQFIESYFTVVSSCQGKERVMTSKMNRTPDTLDNYLICLSGIKNVKGF